MTWWWNTGSKNGNLAITSDERFGGSTWDERRAIAHGTRGWAGVNLRTTFQKLIRRAGLKEWPRLVQNLRASCETDLMAEHPIHVVTAWIGNTPKIALEHYLQTLE